MAKEVIFFIPDRLGGVAYFVKNLLEYNPVSNIYTKVILYRHKQEGGNTINFKYKADEQIYFLYDSRDNKYNVFKQLKQYINSDKSIIVANDGLELSMLNALKLPNPLFYIVHGDNSYYYNLVQMYSGLIDAYITVSKHIEHKIISSNYNINRINTIYAAVTNIEQTVVSKENDLHIIFVGGITENKGVYELIEIIKLISLKKSDIHFTIIGSGSKLSFLYNELSNYKNVSIREQLPHYQVIDCYNNSDIILHPSHSEGLPLVIVEAMKAGVVPICNDIASGIPELITNDETGFVVANNEIEKYVEIILHLYNNRKKIKEIGLQAKHFADTHFEAKTQANKYFEIFLDENNYTENKTYKKLPIGGKLNQKYLPNFLVKTIRTIVKHPKL